MQDKLKWRTFLTNVGTFVAHETEEATEDAFIKVYDVCAISQAPMKFWINKVGNKLSEQEFLNLYASNEVEARNYTPIESGEFTTVYIPLQPNVDFQKTRQALNLNQVILIGTPENQQEITDHVNAVMGRAKIMKVSEPPIVEIKAPGS